MLLSLNASPYHLNKRATRFDVARDNVCAAGMPLVACNLVGGQDELVFDGQTFALQRDGTLAAQALEFDEDLLLVDVDAAARTALRSAAASSRTWSSCRRSTRR